MAKQDTKEVKEVDPAQQLVDANERADRAEDQVAALSGSGVSDRTTKNKPTYPFKVTCMNKPELQPMVIDCIDESEAIRLYLLRRQPGTVLISTRHRFNVECLETPKRVAAGKAARKARNEANGYGSTTFSTVGQQ